MVGFRPRALILPSTLSLDPDGNPTMVRQWFLAASLVRIRWAGVPLCLLLIPLFTSISVPVVLALAVLMGAGNASLGWILEGDLSPSRLHTVRWGSMVFDWAIGLSSIVFFSPQLADWTPALLLLLILTSGIWFGKMGILVAAFLAILNVACLVAAQLYIYRVYDKSYARDAGLIWLLLIAVAACVGFGLTQAMVEYDHWERARWNRYSDILPRFQHGISAREWELLQLLAQDELTYRQIADQLHLSPETIKTHVRHLSKKLGVSGRRQVVSIARQQGLFPSHKGINDRR